MAIAEVDAAGQGLPFQVNSIETQVDSFVQSQRGLQELAGFDERLVYS